MKLLKRIKDIFDSIKSVEAELRNKDFIRVENLKIALKVSSSTAKDILEYGVTAGKLTKVYLVYSPYENVIIDTFKSSEDIPKVVFDHEYEEDYDHAFIKDKHSGRFLEVAYKYA